MRKISYYFFAMLAFVNLSLLTGCGEDPEPPTATLPEPDGTVIITFRNFPGNDPSVTAAPNDVVAVSVLMEKSANGTRPQKLRIYETNVLNTRGTQVKVEGQGNNEGTIDLRNVDEQTKTVDYTVPATATGTIYLYFEVDESNGKFSRKVLRINVTNAGTMATYTNITLGAQNNAAPSRMSSATGYVYLACEVEQNIQFIDLTYSSTGTSTNYLSSNPARFQAPISLQVNTRDCGAEGTIRTDGGLATYFAAATAADFNNATDASLDALNVSNTSPQHIVVTQGGFYAFRTSKGKKGVVKVNTLTAGPSALSI
jgi:hypothetical protein